MTSSNDKQIRIGADVGGTFTDVVVLDERGHVGTRKIPSTPPDFERAVLEAIAELLQTSGDSGASVSEVAHGTTVATNAVLEQRGARTALITTRGFRDVLELRRVRAPLNYDLFFDKPPALVERSRRYELTERMAANGEVLVPVEESELEELKQRLEKEAVESVAVCLLHAYAYPEHERLVGQFLRERLPGIPVSLSSEVLPERKEYERTATTAVNAYVRPLMRNYLRALRQGLREMRIDAPLLIMQSGGGLTPESDAALRPVFVLESGPAAGVLAARFTAQRMGLEEVITLDMGGTTAKAAMIEGGSLAYNPEYEVGASLSASSRLMGGGGELIRVPSIDIAEVGAGGGSIAYLDGAGGLRVGPRSAGAVPGPACYGRGGTDPTLTDANVVLGYIRPGRLADGQVTIDAELARRAVRDNISEPLELDLLAAAEGIHRIANARTMRALREVSTERGRDPRDFALMAFGGSGPIHAVGLAAELAIRRVIVPPLPGLFSALGLLYSGVEHHEIRSCLLTGDGLTVASLEKLRDDMERCMLAQFAEEGFPAAEVERQSSVDARFKGQTSEIRIDVGDGGFTAASVKSLCTKFEKEHERLYGHRSDPDSPIEVVAVRLVGRAAVSTTDANLTSTAEFTVREPSRAAYFGSANGVIDTPVLARKALGEGADGPVLVDEYDSTIVVPPDWRVQLDERGNLILEPRK